MDLLLNAVAAGILLGGFYAAVSIGLTICFGQLDIVNIAHPAFIVFGSFCTFILYDKLGIDPILAGVAMTPVFFFIGLGLYSTYYASFEKRGDESLRGLAFFFGIMFILEVILILTFGVDYRMVETSYIGQTLTLGVVGLPYRLLVPFIVSMAMAGGLYFYLSRTFTGRAILAVAQDRLALQLMGADPVRIKQIAFGIGLSTAAIAGAMLIMLGPVEPSIGRLYIGRVFAIVVLGGMTSISGTLVAALILGVVESLVATYFGPSWSPAVAFGFLLVTLAIRPAGLFGR